ncbi:MAG: hypothetical protein GY764_15195 [Halieaceae bacterium]|nr:hypothetical protein [Halieaceae bacterium]
MSEPIPFLRIRIQAFRADLEGYPTEARLDDGSFYGDGLLRLGFEGLQIDHSNPEAYGAQLHDALFIGPILQAYEDAMRRAEIISEGHLCIQLWIDEEAEELHALRWERLLRNYRRQWLPLAASALTPFSRYFNLTLKEEQAEPARPFKILLAISNPSDLSHFQLHPLDIEGNLNHLLNTCIGQIHFTQMAHLFFGADIPE